MVFIRLLSSNLIMIMKQENKMLISFNKPELELVIQCLRSQISESKEWLEDNFQVNRTKIENVIKKEEKLLKRLKKIQDLKTPKMSKEKIKSLHNKVMY